MNSLERICPVNADENDAASRETLRLHFERYHYAGRHIVPGSVLDIACGVGYGSHLLATQYHEHITKIIAVDCDESSILLARKEYYHPSISFIANDAAIFKTGFPIDNIVCLETLEHLPEPVMVVKNLSRQLVKGGRFIASVPVTPSVDANPYHLHDFSVKQFKQLFLDQGMALIDWQIQVQRYNPIRLMRSKNERTKELRSNMIGFYWRHPFKLWLRVRSIFTDGFTNKYFIGTFEKH